MNNNSLFERFSLFARTVFGKIAGFFPTSLPRGVSEFEAWSDSIISTYGPAGTAESIKWSLATMIMRLDATDARKPKRYFALSLHKGAACEVASFMMREIKDKHDARVKAQLEADAQAKLKSEATALEVATDDTPQQILQHS